MSFRIDDILKDNKCVYKQTDSENANKFTDNSEAENEVVERDKSNIHHPLKSGVPYMDYNAHYLQYLGSQSLELPKESFSGSFTGLTYQSVANCCSRLVPPQVNDNEKVYSTSYIYPEKIYPQTTYNHILPLTFPIFNHYSKRRNQVRFSTSQTKALEHKFSWQKYLSPEDRKLLAYSLKLSDRQVKTWFQNRRAKWRRNINGSSNSDTKPNTSSSPSLASIT